MQRHKYLCESAVISGIYGNSHLGKMKLVKQTLCFILMPFECSVHQLQSDMENEAALT